MAQLICGAQTQKHRTRKTRRFRGCSEWCLCVRVTAIAVPDWALGGHLAMSVNVRVSAERERFRLSYLLVLGAFVSRDLL